MDLLYDGIGLAGVAIGLAAYFLLQKGRFAADSYPYLCMNLLAPILIMISLSWTWNLSAFLLEVAWAGITLYGLHKRWTKDKAIP